MDFLGIGDLDPAEVPSLVKSAADLKRSPTSAGGALAGKSVGIFLLKPSLRTRLSVELAAKRLGAETVVLRNEEVGFGTRESIADVVRVMDRFLDALCLRVFAHTDLVEVAEHATAPVVNLLSDREHPAQAIADLQTIAEHRPLPGAILAYVGDGNNVCHSLLLAGAMAGMRVRVACPPGYQPLPAIVEQAARHGEVLVTDDPARAVERADVVTTDVWASMGQEDEAAERSRIFRRYQVNEELFARAAAGAIFLHCLPAHRGQEVTDGVIDHPRSRVFDQAENRLPSFQAILLRLLG